MSDWWSDHPDLEGVARRGRSELHAEAVEAETDTELLRKRRRSLMDVCFEWMSRGDLVTLGIGNEHFTGQLIAATNDLLILATQDLEMAVAIEAVQFARSDERSRFTGISGDRDHRSFRAWLGSLEVDDEPVRLVGTAFDITAKVTASTDDHVLVTDDQGTEWALPRKECLFGIRSAR